jgi:hypothetical protein
MSIHIYMYIYIIFVYIHVWYIYKRSQPLWYPAYHSSFGFRAPFCWQYIYIYRYTCQHKHIYVYSICVFFIILYIYIYSKRSQPFWYPAYHSCFVLRVSGDLRMDQPPSRTSSWWTGAWQHSTGEYGSTPPYNLNHTPYTLHPGFWWGCRACALGQLRLGCTESQI